jgi:hypothetical protein
MKTNLLRLVLLTTVIFTLNSCSSDASEAHGRSYLFKIVSYSTSELETLKLINDYRVSVGLNVLKESLYLW